MFDSQDFYCPPGEPDWYTKIPAPKFNIGDKVTRFDAATGKNGDEYDWFSGAGWAYIVGYCYANQHDRGELVSLGWVYDVLYGFALGSNGEHLTDISESKSNRLDRCHEVFLTKIK